MKETDELAEHVKLNLPEEHIDQLAMEIKDSPAGPNLELREEDDEVIGPYKSDTHQNYSQNSKPVPIHPDQDLMAGLQSGLQSGSQTDKEEPLPWEAKNKFSRKQLDWVIAFTYIVTATVIHGYQLANWRTNRPGVENTGTSRSYHKRSDNEMYAAGLCVRAATQYQRGHTNNAIAADCFRSALNDYQTALTHWQKETLQGPNSIIRERHCDVADCRLNIAQIGTELSKIPERGKMPPLPDPGPEFLQAIDLFNKAGYPGHEGLACGLYGDYLWSKTEYLQALQYWSKAVQLPREQQH